MNSNLPVPVLRKQFPQTCFRSVYPFRYPCRSHSRSTPTATSTECFWIPALPIAAAMAVCRNCATFISPMVPATLLGVGLADVDINQHIKSNFLWVWGFSFICMIAAILFGIIPV